MPNNFFSFKQFTVYQERSAFKVGTDGVLLGAYADVSGRKRILDLGTGTGLIALMVAQRCDADIVAIEPDQDSFFQASENVLNSKWSGRIRIENCMLQNYRPVDTKFDLIVTNPPFYSDSLKNPDLSRANARHNDNLSHIDILSGAGRLLDPDGKLQLIMPFAEGSVFIAEAGKYGFFCNNILKIKSTPSAEIRRLILSFSRDKMKVIERFLTIESGKRHEFTQDYKNLTKDFYLKF